MEVGSLVECVDDNFPYKEEGYDYPVKGIIYTIIVVRNEFIVLYEIRNGNFELISGGRGEPGWLKKRFRELLPPIKISINELLEKSY